MEMELRLVNRRNIIPEVMKNENFQEAEVIESAPMEKKEKPRTFIEANTEEVTLLHLKNDCVIPTFRDNEKTISHFEFVDAVNFCNIRTSNLRPSLLLRFVLLITLMAEFLQP
jgi:hypothetical protein